MTQSGHHDKIQALQREIAALTEQLSDETDAETRATIVEHLEVDRAVLADLQGPRREA